MTAGTIGGLRAINRDEFFTPEITPDVSQDVDLACEAISLLGHANDMDQLKSDIKARYEQLWTLNWSGEYYVDPPRSIGTHALIAVIDGANYPQERAYPPTYTYNSLWLPGAEEASHSEEQLIASSPEKYMARLALHSDNEDEPLLHLLYQSFDEKYIIPEETPQTQAILEAKNVLNPWLPDRSFEALSHRGFLMIALQRRIAGKPMPVEWGFMRDGTLPRKETDRGSLVSDVCSRNGQLKLYGSSGDAYPQYGIGLSVG